MPIPRSLRRTGGIASVLLASWTGQAAQAAPTVADALKLTPVQKDVEFTTPAKDAIEQCTIKPEKFDNHTGWVIRDKAGQILRRFVDTNADNVVDQWCYYEDGIEVYRDIDADFNGKPDQCRWFNMAGTRWGLDTNEDGKIDRWKEISAEEASDELIRALSTKDPARFTRLLMTTDELKALGLGETRTEELKTKITTAPEQFHKLLAGQKTLARRSSLAAVRRRSSRHHAGRHRRFDQGRDDLRQRRGRRRIERQARATAAWHAGEVGRHLAVDRLAANRRRRRAGGHDRPAGPFAHERS